jgi:hypothetical protein
MNRLVVPCLVLVLLTSGAEGFALDLIRDGHAASTIVVPEQATPLEKQGAQTLAKYLKMAAGVELPVVPEAPDLPGTLVSLGKTRLAKAAGITEEGLKYDGYRMAAKGGRLFLLGRDTDIVDNYSGARGSLRVVFGLLDRLGFRWLQPTPMGTYVPDLKTVAVPDNLDVTYEPPFMYVHGRFVNQGDWSMANSFRCAARLFSAGGHTWVYGVPATLYDSHPEYFVMRDGKRVKPAQADNPQYCPTNPDLPKLVADWTIKKFDEGYDIVALGHSDGFQPCQCEQCAKLSPADQVHNAQRKIIELVGRKYPDRKVHLLIYSPAILPPTQFKSYPPNTMVEVCLTETVQTPFGSHDKALDYWHAAVPGGTTVYAYYMGEYYDNGLAPRFIPSLAAAKLRNWHGHGVQGIYWCGGNENWGGEGPTYYTIGRLATDVTLDPAKVYQEYISLTFRKAAPAMKQYYDLLYEQLQNHRSASDDWVMAGVGCGADETFASLYSADTLLKLRAFLDATKQQAAGDARALGWVRLAEMSYNHYSLIAKAFHFYRAYLLNPTAENLKQVRGAVEAYQAWADETIRTAGKDRAFADNFLPSAGLWANQQLKTNYGHLRCAPFTWDFEKMKPGAR